MELRGKIEAEFVLTPDESAAILQGMLAAGGTATAAPRTAEVKSEPAPAPARDEKKLAQDYKNQAQAPTSQPTQAPVPRPQTQSAPRLRTAPAAPASEYKETPEQAVSLLKQQFGIDKPKEERTPDEQQKAVALNRAILGLIRDITRDGSAQSLADLGNDLNRTEFVRRCMKLAYDANNNSFSELPF